MKRSLPVLLLASPALLAQSQATYYSAYEDGLALQSRGKQAAALAAFQRAAELRPQPGRRLLTYGTNFLDEYFPWLKIAQCALAVKDLETAEEALRRSAQYGSEPAGERERLQKLLAGLKAPAPAPQPAPVQPPAPQPAPQVQPQPQPQPAPQPAPVQPPVQVPAQVPPAQGTRPPSLPAKDIHAPAPTPAPTSALPQPVPTPSPTPAVPSPGPMTAIPEGPAPRPFPLGWALGGVALLAGGVVFATFKRRRRTPARSRGDLGDTDQTSLIQSLARTMHVSVQQTQMGDVKLGSYTLRKVLGKGACGTTFMGIRDENGQEVAIKVPHPHMLEDQEFMARFRQEAALGAKLVHPKIVRIIDPGPNDGTPWLAMELVRGHTLDSLLQERRLSLAQVLDLGIDICEAMAYAHSQGVVHRDLKPANIMVGDGGAQVLDFGIARLTEGVGMTATQVFIGTPLYASPESVSHSRVGPGADRYAFGCIIFELITGRPPFTAATAFAVLQKHISEPFPDLDALVPGLPPRLIRLIQRLTAKHPEDRPEDGEVLTILREIRKGI